MLHVENNLTSSEDKDFCLFANVNASQVSNGFIGSGGEWLLWRDSHKLNIENIKNKFIYNTVN
ncbi:hypothetical protein CE143_03605 [Photorhabdus luminescens]|uniref:Uncharacterized protein n=1 Tax=Photorhabdus akhurstii TaxID=171438 RepID=A0ABX8LU11_9GAMM|nr:hypothetical protein KS18_16020 [Photorhabdus luminescens]PQQ33088.1 hypothetical protein C6H69_12305 [Photorhabdus luminescens]PQQ42300.1 hypothetical protein C6H65_03695 [Photorhabdus luminescens]QXF32357.1 hypothetical protein B0X70_03670 [Photorhabdus akhurstii]UJD74151.1 hypothetical protein CE143_03605 [Photorhabdus luminescens]